MSKKAPTLFKWDRDQTEPADRVPAVPGASAQGGAQEEGGREDGRGPMVSSLGRAAGFGGTALDRTFPVGGTVWGDDCRHKRAYGEQGGQGGWLSCVPGHGVWPGPRANRTASEAQRGHDPCASSRRRRRLRQGDRKPSRGTCRSPGGRGGGGGCGWRGLARCYPEGQAHWHWGTGRPEAATLHT